MSKTAILSITGAHPFTVYRVGIQPMQVTTFSSQGVHYVPGYDTYEIQYERCGHILTYNSAEIGPLARQQAYSYLMYAFSHFCSVCDSRKGSLAMQFLDDRGQWVQVTRPISHRDEFVLKYSCGHERIVSTLEYVNLTAVGYSGTKLTPVSLEQRLQDFFGHCEVCMGAIPTAVSYMRFGTPEQLNLLLRAILLRLQEDDEDAVLSITREHMDKAQMYTLITSVIEEEIQHFGSRTRPVNNEPPVVLSLRRR